MRITGGEPLVRADVPEIVRLIASIEGIETVELTHKDVVRHSLVMQIIKAYNKDEEKVQKK